VRHFGTPKVFFYVIDRSPKVFFYVIDGGEVAGGENLYFRI